MMTFQEKTEEARKAGYSDEEIYNFLAQKAKQQGYSDKEIRDYLTQQGLFQKKPARIPPLKRMAAEIKGITPALKKVQPPQAAKRHWQGLQRWTKGYWDAVSKGKIKEFQALETQLSEEKRNPIDTLEYIGWAGLLACAGITGVKLLGSIPKFVKAVSKVKPHLAKPVQEIKRLTPQEIQARIGAAVKKAPKAPPYQIPAKIQPDIRPMLKKAVEKLPEAINIDALQPRDILNADTCRASFLKTMDEARQTVKTGDKNLSQQVYNHILKLNELRVEAGRLLGATRDPSFDANSTLIKTIYNDTVKINPGDIAGLQKFFKDVAQPRNWDKLVELRGSLLLTSPKTTMRATIGNLIGRIYKPGERFMAGAWENIRHILTGKPKERFCGEAAADIYGTLKSIPEAFGKAWRAFLRESYMTQSRAVEAMTYKRGFAIKGVLGKFARAGFRGVTAVDEFCHTLSKQASLHAQAYRQAAKEGKTLKEMIMKTADYAKSPTFRMAAEATREALIETQRMQLGRAGRSFSRWINYPGNPLKLVLVFCRTPVNLIKWGFLRSPFGIIRNIQQIIKAPGAAERADVIGQMMAAQMVNAYIAYQVIEGNITGCLSYDKKKRLAQIRAGIKPYSIKIGDKHYSYSFAQPLGLQMAIVANVCTKVLEGKKIGYDSIDKEVEQFTAESIKNLKSATYLTGIRDLTRAFEMPQIYGKQFAQKFIVSFTPRFLMWMQRVSDPMKRSPETIIEKFKAVLPGISKKVRPFLDVYGKPIMRDETLLQRALLPTYLSEEKKDIVSRELMRLDKPINYPSRKLRGEKMTGDEYNQYLKESGGTIFNCLAFIFGTDLYAKLPDDEKIRIIDKVVSMARTVPRWKVLLEQIRTDIEALNEAGAKPKEKVEYLKKRGFRLKGLTPSQKKEEAKKKAIRNKLREAKEWGR